MFGGGHGGPGSGRQAVNYWLVTTATRAPRPQIHRSVSPDPRGGAAERRRVPRSRDGGILGSRCESREHGASRMAVTPRSAGTGGSPIVQNPRHKARRSPRSSRAAAIALGLRLPLARDHSLSGTPRPGPEPNKVKESIMMVGQAKWCDIRDQDLKLKALPARKTDQDFAAGEKRVRERNAAVGKAHGTPRERSIRYHRGRRSTPFPGALRSARMPGVHSHAQAGTLVELMAGGHRRPERPTTSATPQWTMAALRDSERTRRAPALRIARGTRDA